MSDSSNRMMRYDAMKRSAGLAYLIWFFLGMFGVHRFYFKKTGTGVAILLMSLLSPLTLYLTAAVAFIWVLVDAFLIPGWTEAYNLSLARKLGAESGFSD